MNKNIDIFEIFPWDSNFETGIEKIDEQHKKLVEILNRLAAHLASHSNIDELNDIFDELANYADYHFKTEEGVWSQYFENDKWFTEHEKTHGSFLDEVVAIKENKKHKAFDEVIYEIVLFLAQWLAYHILDTDKRMAKVVLEIEAGRSLEDAKKHSNEFMNGSIKTLIDTVLKMYSDISTRTLDLMREKALRIKAEKALQKSEEKWKFILDNSDESIWDCDLQKDQACISQEGSVLDKVITNSLDQFDNFSQIHPDDIERVRKDFLAHLKGETEFYYNKHRVLRKDGSWNWILSRGKVLKRNEEGMAERIIGIHSDITERELSSIIYQNSSQAMFICDQNNKIISINPAFTEITQYKLEDVIGKDPNILASGELDEEFYQRMWSDLFKHDSWSGEVINRRKDGELYIQELNINVVKNPQGLIDHYVGLFSDISEKKKSEDLIVKQANFDPLTDLENRRMFEKRLLEAISLSNRNKLPFAVLFIDLDHFKDINDTLGHVVGDSILIQVASRIKKEIRDTDVLSRFGGDEFTLLLSNIKNTTVIDRIAQNIIDSIKKPFEVQERTLHLSASIGITLYPDDGRDNLSLLRNADQAMYQAKHSGRSKFNYFTSHMQELAQKRHTMLNDMHNAIKEKQFEVYYQPIVDTLSGKVVKAEALVRWNHPQNGLVSPGEFIPLAEESGLIVEIGGWIYKTAVLQVARWRELYDPQFKVSINKSPIQFKTSQTLAEWMAHIDETGVDGTSVIIEVTESILMEEDELVKEKLLTFREKGIEVAIDDFGTGYSSLSYLKKFDIDYLKIDKSFVDNLVTSQQDKVLSEAMIAMAHKLDIQVIAEGVENAEQKEILTSMGCDFIQGYIYSKPLPAKEFERVFLA
ncbi:bacteriohemerythrin [Sulfurimonas microaerophilic]|uniref:bacteriohemerythrin n=1 Tax=Sulfurimonas microaerophilic TaxID=3058392 RepID=UPI002714EE87|nr:bacteriohemerythrin [Sulfurimonas sp. hsl 1-7]